ncbi:MAG: hypothetical protein EHM55_10535 [Acidobacteria bacterium]|nr:MAG: hypothetical protein EHM55_10535 [Acidobacteriota bacterium]
MRTRASSRGPRLCVSASNEPTTNYELPTTNHQPPTNYGSANARIFGPDAVAIYCLPLTM